MKKLTKYSKNSSNMMICVFKKHNQEKGPDDKDLTYTTNKVQVG